MDQNLKRTIMLEHYQNPKNKGLIEDDRYIKVNMNNESCIDEVNIMLYANNDKIEDVLFDGEACAICTSSSSIMTSILIGKTIDEALNIIKNFYNMIDESKYDEKVLEEAIVYDDIYKQPNRKKCALLPWWGAEKAVEEFKNEKYSNSANNKN